MSEERKDAPKEIPEGVRVVKITVSYIGTKGAVDGSFAWAESELDMSPEPTGILFERKVLELCAQCKNVYETSNPPEEKKIIKPAPIIKPAMPIIRTVN